MSSRAAPFYCPYCGEETLEPVEDSAWHCHGCDRVFEVHFKGLAGS